MTFFVDLLSSPASNHSPTRYPTCSSRLDPSYIPNAERLKPNSQSRPPIHHPSPSVAGPVSRVVDGFLSLKDGLTREEREERRLRDERRQILHARMVNAETFSHWDAAAHELDVLEGNEEWKADVFTGDYDPNMLQMRLDELDDARRRRDVGAMMHLVRTALSRDLGGMGNIDLYRHSYCGTKKLIERYVDSALQTIAALVERSAQHSSLPSDLGPRDLLDSMLYARQSFGRSALLLSGGGTFGMTHIGVLKSLFEAKLLPRIISGASAGSIVCAVVCAKTDDEIPQVIKEFPHGDLAVFEEQGNEDGILDHLRRLLTEGNWSDIRHLTRVMRDLLGDITFQEAYNRTRRICNICVSTASIYELPRLLNYVTAPNVMIWSAVAASCSVPIVFSAAALLVKNPLTGEHSPWNPTPQMWIDGSVDNDLPMVKLAEMFNVNHFIVSQVNPHVVPFLAKDEISTNPGRQRHSAARKEESDWVRKVTSLAKSEAIHRMQFMAELGVLPNLVGKLKSILSQTYAGDVNILPAIGVFDLPNILKNPTTEFMTRSCLLGERATWPKLARVRDRCAIELALDRAVHALRAGVVFSKSQVDLRRMVTGSAAMKKKMGSHDPLVSNRLQEDSTSSEDTAKRRDRRLSGSNVDKPYRADLSSDSPYKVTENDDDDDDSDGEGQLGITMGHPRGKPNLNLKNLPKRTTLVGGPKTGPATASTSEVNAFDFTRSLILSPPTSSRLAEEPTNANPGPETDGKPVVDGVGHLSDTGSISSPSPAPEFGTSDGNSSDPDFERRATTTGSHHRAAGPSIQGKTKA
ncbi:patatin-domain-containing protein [Poronia punctata]|nr:patatin-domain-containing protein [Poronia punctata]